MLDLVVELLLSPFVTQPPVGTVPPITTNGDPWNGRRYMDKIVVTDPGDDDDDEEWDEDEFEYEDDLDEGIYGDDEEEEGVDDEPRDSNDCMIEENEVDAKAEEVAGDILQNPDSQEFEFVSFLWRSAGGALQFTEPLQLDPGGGIVRTPQEVTPYGDAQIVGWVHNHPYDTIATPRHNEFNRNPSAGDWQTFDNLITGGYASTDLSLYLIGPDGVLREFTDGDQTDHTGDSPGGGIPKLPDADNTVRDGTCGTN